jgi:NAD(P)H-hydrate epimerase
MQSHLAEREVQLLEVADPLAAMPALNSALKSSPRLIVDGLFGIGLNRALDRPWCEFIQRVDEARIPVLAVDVPSGLDAETGQPLPAAIRAAWTATVGAPKHGFFAAGASDYIGRIEVLGDVGLIPCPISSELQWTEPGDFAAFPPLRPVAGHKGTFGHAGIVAGSLGYHGASVLAARGAQRAQPGLITLFTQPETYAPVAAQLQAVMVHPWSEETDLSRFTALLFGPGLAAAKLPKSVREHFGRAWKTAPIPIAVDASALDWVPASDSALPSIRVLTPHPGEAARLLGCSTAEVQRDRVAALRALSKRFGDCWVV